MAISATTFSERINRINSGKTLNAPDVSITAPKRGPKKRKGLMMPLLICAAILGGGGAMAWTGTTVDYEWVLAFAQQ